MADGHDCGQTYATYLAALSGDADAMRTAWENEANANTTGADALDVTDPVRESITDAVRSGDTDRVATLLAGYVFTDEPTNRLDGLLATVVGTLLWAFGYVAAFVLFFRAHSREAVVSRLRWAYGVVGVDIRAIETVEDAVTAEDDDATDITERTVFRCPYRTLGADRWGERRVCHDVLDRVDDGYVTFLDRHRDLDYDRPRPCASGPCCYSEVTER